MVQTPFLISGQIDDASLQCLVDEAVEAGAAGLLAPAVASENAWLSLEEKLHVAARVQEAAGSLPVFWGVGSHEPAVIERIGLVARRQNAAGLLVAVPPELYRNQTQVVPYFTGIARQAAMPLMVQDLDFTGPGLELGVIEALFDTVPEVRYLKIETVPAGPKYSTVLTATAGKLHVSGGWAVPQLIEALDRGVHAMIPESSMVSIYVRIVELHRSGKRAEALQLFRRLLPVLAFANQDLATSIRFFKRLLVRKGIFATAICRLPAPEFDAYQLRAADELIDLVLSIETDISVEVSASTGRSNA